MEIFGDLAVTLVAELGAVLSGIGMTPTESARGARVMYFAYLGIIMTAGNFAAISRSPLEQIRESVSFVLSAHQTVDRHSTEPDHHEALSTPRAGVVDIHSIRRM
ncbi:hypothetical protein ACIBM3_32950 [Rhodococcus erythropolis]|uniref:hypothetical protein n=1 Tax=Rhodococcus erythropolis TaxID=1833 RepID=UPI0037AE924F